MGHDVFDSISLLKPVVFHCLTPFRLSKLGANVKVGWAIVNVSFSFDSRHVVILQ